jgi:PBP1b-binding outer membrane lipoprotein LpoB
MNPNYQSENPLKTFLQTLLVLALVFMLTLLMNGCASKPLEKTHTIERVVTYKADSLKVTVVNQAVLDSLFIQVSKVKTLKPECDSITQMTLDQLLVQLNSKKKSGDNAMGIYYDTIKKMIVGWQKMAKTLNENSTSNKTTNAIAIEKESVEIPVKFIPFWVKILAVLGGISVVLVVWRVVKIWV